MRFLSATMFLTLFAMTFSAGAAPLPAAYQVDIPLGNGVLHAQLYKPDGDGPFPTVIALHDCGGLGGHSAPVQPRYHDWAELLLKAGDAVVLPDSYGARALGPPISCHRGNGCCSSPGPRMIASACSDGQTAPAPCCGRCVRNCRHAPSRISARRLPFIRTAASRRAWAGAPAFR